MDLKISPGESRSQGAKWDLYLETNKEIVTEHQGSRNESFGGLKWPLSAYSGIFTLGSGTGSQNGFHIIVCRLTQGVLRLCSGLLRIAQACSSSAQVKVVVAHVYRLKRNQRKGKLILSLGVFGLVGLMLCLADENILLFI
jgi:hypothetical protein